MEGNIYCTLVGNILLDVTLVIYNAVLFYRHV